MTPPRDVLKSPSSGAHVQVHSVRLRRDRIVVALEHKVLLPLLRSQSF